MITTRQRFTWALAAATMAAGTTGLAHFVFVVPGAGDGTASVVLSETLYPDAQVDITLIEGTTLWWRDASGRERQVSMTLGEDEYTIPVEAGTHGLIRGVTALGVHETETVDYLLFYYPKAVVGDPFAASAVIGDRTPIEIVPVASSGGVRLRVLDQGQPIPGRDVTVIVPGGDQHVVTTDADGLTPVMPGHGQFGAWARAIEPTSGTHDGQPYSEVRRYATIVFDTTAAGVARADAPRRMTIVPTTLPEASASLGVVESDGWVYVYGGHVTPTHRYSTEAVSGRFSRIRADLTGGWQGLPGGPGLQGLNLAAYGGRIIRVGGMAPRNAPGAPQDIHSVADVAAFDPVSAVWEALPDLPAGRSSHDVAVVGGQLYAIGGWMLRGGEPAVWHTTMAVLDLTAPGATWRDVGQPFVRRALITAVVGHRVFVAGGIDEDGTVSRDVWVYDTATTAWTAGPALPGDGDIGFSPAAAVVDGELYVSVADGRLYRLAGHGWQVEAEGVPRVAHRMVAAAGVLVAMGGADLGLNLDVVERLDVRR